MGADMRWSDAREPRRGLADITGSLWTGKPAHVHAAAIGAKRHNFGAVKRQICSGSGEVMRNGRSEK